MARQPKRKKPGKPTAPAAVRRQVKPMKIRLPKYDKPKDDRLFRLDVEIGRNLLELPDALSERKIMKYFGIDKQKFNERARAIAPTLKAAQMQDVVDLLVAMGISKAARKE